MKPAQLDTNVRVNGLLGKWRDDRDSYRQSRGFRLRDHMIETMDAMRFLFEEPFYSGTERYASLGAALYGIMRLDRQNCTFAEFRRWCFLAVLAHDLGKCGGEFQQMMWVLEALYRMGHPQGGSLGTTEVEAMRKKMHAGGRYQQAYRHELLSAILVFRHPEIRSWFREQAGSDAGVRYITAAAFGHHLKATIERAMRTERFADPNFQAKPVFLASLSEAVNGALERIPLDGIPAFPVLEDWREGHPMASAKSLDRTYKELQTDDAFYRAEDNPVSGAIKWLVILADVYGSIASRPGESVEATRGRIYEGLRSVFQRTSVGYESRIEAHLGDLELLPFQKRCRTFKNLLAAASTGEGKSIGSLAWASVKPSLRLIFCGHTMDATTCLYSDYANRTRDTLRHSRAFLDADRLAVTPEDTAGDIEEAAEEEAGCLDVFRDFGHDVTFTTADQILGIMSFYRKSVLWLPHVLTSQITFDEVHSYDPTMQRWYFKFLEWLPGIRTAHLSATIPDAVVEEIAKRIPRSNLKCPAPRIVRDSRRWGQPRRKKRYRIHILRGIEEAQTLFGPGALWFANTVERCQKIGLAFPDALAYHSRFRYIERDTIRQILVAGMPNSKDADRPLLYVVATQAAEMSLNISAWLLISEICPPAAVIQRLGRENRPLLPGRIADAYFYMPEMTNGQPYVVTRDWEAEYGRWERWIRQFEGREVSQDDLDAAFQEFYRDPRNRCDLRMMRTDLLRTERRNVRQAIVTIPVLLQEDLDQIRALPAERISFEIAKRTVPALVTAKERAELRRSGSLFWKTFVIDAPYDLRLGLLQKKIS